MGKFFAVLGGLAGIVCGVLLPFAAEEKITAKLTGIIWLVTLLLTLSIGFYVGVYNFFKIRSEAKKLGLA